MQQSQNKRSFFCKLPLWPYYYFLNHLNTLSFAGINTEKPLQVWGQSHSHWGCGPRAGAQSHHPSPLELAGGTGKPKCFAEQSNPLSRSCFECKHATRNLIEINDCVKHGDFKFNIRHHGLKAWAGMSQHFLGFSFFKDVKALILKRKFNENAKRQW